MASALQEGPKPYSCLPNHNREEVPPGNNQKGLLEGKPTVQLNRTLGFPDLSGYPKTQSEAVLNRFFFVPYIESAKTDPVRLKWGFGEGRLKDNFAFFEAYKNPIPKRRKLLAKRPFL